MNNYTTDTFQKYERKRPSKRLLDPSLDEHSERYNKHSKQKYKQQRQVKRSWEGE